MRERAIGTAWLGGALVLAFASRAAAQDGQPITNNHYAIDLTRGPVIGSGRQVGMAGAFTALVDGVDGALWNPAAYSSRAVNDASDWHFDGGLSGSWITNDFDNSGQSNERYNYYVIGLGALGLQYGPFGMGGIIEVHDYNVGQSGGAQFNVTTLLAHAGLAYNFFDGQFVLGIGGRYSLMSIWNQIGQNTAVARYEGWAAEIGAVFRPERVPIRIGLAAHSTVTATHPPLPENPAGSGVMRGGDCGTLTASTCFVLPEAVVSPWQLNAGIAYQFGPRPWNAHYENPSDDAMELQQRLREAHRQRRDAFQQQLAAAPREQRQQLVAAFQAQERTQAQADAQEVKAAQRPIQQARVARYAARPRRYLLASIDLQITGNVTQSGYPYYGQGTDAFLLQVQHPSGQNVTYSPRLGLESEVWENRLVLRAGTYYEPSRYDNTGARVHGTVGFDAHIFDTTLFGLFDTTGIRLTAVLDVANNYLNWGLGLGFWH